MQWVCAGILGHAVLQQDLRAHQQDARVGVGDRSQALQAIGLDVGVGIQRHEVVAAGLARADVDGGGVADVCARNDHANLLVVAGKALGEHRTGAVVDHEHLKRRAA